MRDLDCGSLPGSLRTCTSVSSAWITEPPRRRSLILACTLENQRSQTPTTQLDMVWREMSRPVMPRSASILYRGMELTYLPCRTQAISEGEANELGMGRCGMSARLK